MESVFNIVSEKLIDVSNTNYESTEDFHSYYCRWSYKICSLEIKIV
jgi:hypothetical protein